MSYDNKSGGILVNNSSRVRQLYRALVLVLLAAMLPVAPMPATPIVAAPAVPDVVTLDSVATRLATLPAGMAGMMAEAVPDTLVYLLGGYRSEPAQGGGVVKTLSRDIYRYDAVLDWLSVVDDLPTGLALAAAVANAGGLGMVSMEERTPPQMAEMLDKVHTLTTGAVGANFMRQFVEPALAHECVAVAASRVKVVEFFYTEPDPALVEIVHRAGALACWQVGSLREALSAVAAGCDFIIAQGIEAGGHVRGTISLLALLGQVLEAVDVPVLAAGGIGSGRALAAVLAAGAAGAQVGTRFVAAEEADAHLQYVRALIAAKAQDTVYTEAFCHGWPHTPHRCLRSCVEAAAAFSGEFVGECPHDSDASQRLPVHRFQPLVISSAVTGTIAAMPHWAGESVDGVTWVQTAAEIIDELASEAERCLRHWG